MSGNIGADIRQDINPVLVGSVMPTLVQPSQAKSCTVSAPYAANPWSANPDAANLVSHAGAAAELRDLTGVWAAVRYLVAVGGTQTGLVKRHAGWILTVDPEAGLEMFTEMQPPLPPDSVLPILAGHAPSLCATYLESAIAQGSVSAQVCYCLSCIVMQDGLGQSDSWHPSWQVSVCRLQHPGYSVLLKTSCCGVIKQAVKFCVPSVQQPLLILVACKTTQRSWAAK